MSLPTLPAGFLVIAETEAELPLARLIAKNVGCEAALQSVVSSEVSLCLTVSERGIALEQFGKGAPGPVAVDFAEGALAHRRKYGGGKGQLIAKAVGLKGSFLPFVLDATAGLGGDAFVLASLGCRVQMLERSPVVFTLLKDGLERALVHQQAEDDGYEPLASIAARMLVSQTDAKVWMRDLADNDVPDVIYFDPMFPERKKTARVNKAMSAFHGLVGQDPDAADVLQLALQTARYRVVVKRPRLAAEVGKESRFSALKLPAPSHQVVGKTSRYDVYTLKKLPVN